MIKMKTVKNFMDDFVKWNGWGPPTSEYQIIEYCQNRTSSEEEANVAFDILKKWMLADAIG